MFTYINFLPWPFILFYFFLLILQLGTIISKIYGMYSILLDQITFDVIELFRFQN